MKQLSLADMQDLLLGCTILGTGGGGEMSEGLALLEDVYHKGLPVTLVSLQEAPDDAMVCTPYLLGALDLSEKRHPKYQRLPQSEAPAICAAYSRLEQHLNTTFYGTLCCEMGGSNTAVAFYTAALNGGVVIDADPAGRAVPEITHSTYYLNNLPAAPIVAANTFDEVFIVEHVKDDLRAEQLMRALCQESANDNACIDHAMKVKDIKHAVIEGTLSKAWKLGVTARQAQQKGRDVASSIALMGNGFVSFRGDIEHFSFDTQAGFTVGDVKISGTGKFAHHCYTLAVKNENLVAYFDGELDVTIPDLICVIDTETGLPVTNPHYHKGQSVAVIILPAPTEFTTSRGLSVFGPAYAGIDASYRPASPRNVN